MHEGGGVRTVEPRRQAMTWAKTPTGGRKKK